MCACTQREIVMRKIGGKKIIDQKTLLSRREEKSKLFIFHNFLSLSGGWGGALSNLLSDLLALHEMHKFGGNEGGSSSIYLKRKKVSLVKENYHKLTTLHEKLLQLSIEITFF